MDQLVQPIGLLMRPTFTVDLQDSLETAARKMRENGYGLLPATQDGFLAGSVSEEALASAMAAGMELTEPVESLVKGALTATPSTTGAQALRLFESHGASGLIVIDQNGKPLGILAPSDLYPKHISLPRPPLVGGMATPFGVYLTTGSIRAGVGDLALMTTGMCMFGLLLAGVLITSPISDQLVRWNVPANVAQAVEGGFPYVIFLLGMRLLPLSGIHAAEHKVVHAIERGEELVPATVRRMPRVHPRCGTNLAVGASIFIGLGTLSLISQEWLRLMIAGIATLALWRPLGNKMQYYVTTKRPTEKQIAMGIRSGRELLDKYAQSNGKTANFAMRLANSGMLHVIAGSMILGAVVALIGWLFHIPALEDLSLGG